MKIRAIAFGAVASAAILGWLIYGSLGPMLRIAADIHRGYALLAVLCAFASYGFIGLALWEVLRLLGFKRPYPEICGIAFVSTSANYFVSSMGVSGFALKAHLLRKRNVPFGATVTASVTTTALMYAVLGAIILQGLLYYLVRLHGGKIQVLEGALGLALLGLTSVPILLLFFHRETRGKLVRRVFHWMNKASFTLAQQEIPHEDFAAFERQFDQGLDTIRAKRGGMTITLGYTCLDWAFTIAVLYFGFRAVGAHLTVGHLSAGFAVGMACTLIPILPGGLGAMEASMAAVFTRMGIAWETALVAVLLYRIAYYIFPGILSVFLLWGLKMSEPGWAETAAQETAPEEQRLSDLREGRASGEI